MKKKLNFLCVVMLVLLLVQAVCGFFNQIPCILKAGVQGALAGLNFFNLLKSDFEVIPFIAIFLLIGVIILMYPPIRGFISFCKFILNINRDKVFVKENIPLLRWTGWGFLIYNIATFLIKLIVMYVNNGELLSIQFNIIYKQHEDGFIFSIFCLIIAEVFLIGIKLKDEQELTI